MANYSRKMLEQVPDQFELSTILTPTISNLIQNYAPPKTRTINGKSLENDIWLTAADVGARSNIWLPTPEEISAYRCISPDGVPGNFVAFGLAGTKTLVDSGRNYDTWLPAKYLPANNEEVLQVNASGTVNSVQQSTLRQYAFEYSATKNYELGESFFYGSGTELGLYTTTVPHSAETFNASHNRLISKVGLSTDFMDFTLTTPVSSSAYILTGTLQQQLQGLLNNIKNLQDRVEWLENNAVTTDNYSSPNKTGLASGKVKLNVGTTTIQPQTGYYIVRIDPNEILS